MSAPILVTGGTGTLGTLLVRELQARGREVRVLSRKPRPGSVAGVESAPMPGEPQWFVGDLLTGIGVPAAVDGVHTIVHCATGLKGDAKMGAQLMIAAARANHPHIVFPSMVGCETVRSPQYRDKRAVERMLESGDLPWTVMRCTHFHEHLEAELAHAARFPLMLVPGATSFQPIAAAEVADRMADLCTGIQSHRVPDMGGPQILSAVEFASIWLAETGRVRKVLEVNKRGHQYEGWRTGAHLAPERGVGEQTFAAYLAATRRFREAEAVAFEAVQEQQRATDRELARAAKDAAKAQARAAKEAEKLTRKAEEEARKVQREHARAERLQPTDPRMPQPPMQQHPMQSHPMQPQPPMPQQPPMQQPPNAQWSTVQPAHGMPQYPMQPQAGPAYGAPLAPPVDQPRVPMSHLTADQLNPGQVTTTTSPLPTQPGAEQSAAGQAFLAQPAQDSPAVPNQVAPRPDAEQATPPGTPTDRGRSAPGDFSTA